ncbi:MAG: cell division protein FtsL [Clostridiales bacterium]
MTAKVKSSGVKSPMKPWGLYILLFLLFFGINILYIGTGSLIQGKGEIIQNLKAEIVQGEREYDKLSLTAAKLCSPQRIEYIATDTLGMVALDKESTVFYTNSDSNENINNNTTAVTSDNIFTAE